MADMGIGLLGAPNVIIKRKFRFTFEMQTPAGLVPIWFVKVAARPKLDVEPTEIAFRNATTWIPGKAKWQPITVQYIDVPHASMGALYSWMANIYNFTQGGQSKQSEKCGWAGTAIIRMFDGCGTPLEMWELGSCWPESINFGDLAYESSEVATIDVSLRYSEATYTAFCGPNPSGSCCGC